MGDLGIPDCLSICVIALGRAFDALGPLWTDGSGGAN
jgi:hypothetical protein